MKEEYRIQMINRIESERKRIEGIKNKVGRLRELEAIPEVKEYLMLQNELNGVRAINDSNIIDAEKDRAYYNVKTDNYMLIKYYMVDDAGWFPMTARKEPDFNFEANRVELYSLDCGNYSVMSFEEFKKLKRRFNVVNNIPLIKSYGFDVDVVKLRNYYFELLMHHTSEEAIRVFMMTYEEKLKSKYR